MFSAVPSTADERREEGTRVRQPPGHSDEDGRGDSGPEGARVGGSERGRSLSQVPKKTEPLQRAASH